MSELRDARLQRALQTAPDSQLMPRADVRAAIQRAARAAQPAFPPDLWWRRLWAGSGRARMPWNAAFASVLVASLVTLLWSEREIPSAAPQAVRQDAPAAVNQAAPAASSAPAPASSGQTPPSFAAKAAKVPAAKRVQAPPAPSAESRERGDQQVSAPVDEGAHAPLAKNALPSGTEAPRRADTAGQPPPVQDAAPPRAVAAPVLRQAPSLSSAAAPAALQPAAVDWNLVRIEIGGRQLELPRERASRLAELLEAIAALPRQDQVLDSPAVARLELLRDGQAVQVLELAPPQIRWTLPAQAGGRAGTATRPGAAQLDALHEELLRLGRR